MKSFTMKALALAVLGLAGVGGAQAACTNSTPFAAWSSWNGTTNTGAQLGGSTVGGSGLNNTACGMVASFTHPAPSSNGEQAVVFDSSPNFEGTYRFRFYVDPTNIANSLSTTNTVAIFQAKSQLAHGATPTQGIVQMYLVGSGTNVALRTFAACGSGDNFLASRCRATNDVVLGPKAGPFTNGIRVEGQVIMGGAGTGKVNVWVGTNVGTPDATINVDNSAWYAAGSEGVKQAVLGLFQGSIPFRGATTNLTVTFDEFDSRRQTAIGL